MAGCPAGFFPGWLVARMACCPDGFFPDDLFPTTSVQAERL